jgi:5'-methylthioadenosine phosphorylase
MESAEIGIFGGSGFYSFLEDFEELKVDTPYGAPSSQVALGKVGTKSVAFLPRHGADHQYPPHAINYRANMWAFREVGVKRVIGPCAAGSLQPHVKPGEFVICDQLVDRTWGRKDTFYDGPVTTHVSFADPYCPECRQAAGRAASHLRIPCHDRGTVVVIQGPRFSTRAESKWFGQMGWEVINMTQYPEAILARELGMCYVNISLITDYDVGLEGSPETKPVTHEEVIRVFRENNHRLRGLLFRMVEELADDRTCECEAIAKAGGMG